ncbi:uncharacterized protein C8Q71DRAFT_897893 [Rhodofomes roseus]|uniref:Uncharacterized protein n=1 Tax=Rhodofomes roseus TaxID=34475 RepID=A0ABQ8KJB6_9APHY|nr:uncharacterized protein C8Q71DRAFT_897893 [Rhodofomes roseus]KAH9837608.1 hypothetical protein C8Q71DRAFT_897893 [Rhodofomes roseus]
MPSPNRRIWKPRAMPSTLYTGSRSYINMMHITLAEFDNFRAIVHRSIRKYLDLSKTFMAQDARHLERHYTEVARKWKAAEKYEDAWPVRAYTAYRVSEYRKQQAAKQRQDDDDENEQPGAGNTQDRDYRPPRHEAATRAHKPRKLAQLPESSSPEPSDEEEAVQKVDPRSQSAIRTPPRPTPSAKKPILGLTQPPTPVLSEPQPQPRRLGSVSRAPTHRPAPPPHSQQAPNQPQPRRSVSRAPTHRPALPPPHGQQARNNDGFAPVLRFLRSLTPSLEHLAVQLRAAGIKDAERLRIVASWEKRRKKWLVDKLRMSPFEEEVLRIGLDEVRRGVRIM